MARLDSTLRLQYPDGFAQRGSADAEVTHRLRFVGQEITAPTALLTDGLPRRLACTRAVTTPSHPGFSQPFPRSLPLLLRALAAQLLVTIKRYTVGGICG